MILPAILLALSAGLYQGITGNIFSVAETLILIGIVLLLIMSGDRSDKSE